MPDSFEKSVLDRLDEIDKKINLLMRDRRHPR
jgi:hypothetical protein